MEKLTLDVQSKITNHNRKIPKNFEKVGKNGTKRQIAGNWVSSFR